MATTSLSHHNNEEFQRSSSIRTSTSASEDRQSHGDCTICKDKLNSSSVTLGCKHVFHKDCIDKWLNRRVNCPLCRQIPAHSCGHVHRRRLWRGKSSRELLQPCPPCSEVREMTQQLQSIGFSNPEDRPREEFSHAQQLLEDCIDLHRVKMAGGEWDNSNRLIMRRWSSYITGDEVNPGYVPTVVRSFSELMATYEKVIGHEEGCSWEGWLWDLAQVLRAIFVTLEIFRPDTSKHKPPLYISWRYNPMSSKQTAR